MRTVINKSAVITLIACLLLWGIVFGYLCYEKGQQDVYSDIPNIHYNGRYFFLTYGNNVYISFDGTEWDKIR